MSGRIGKEDDMSVMSAYTLPDLKARAERKIQILRDHNGETKQSETAETEEAEKTRKFRVWPALVGWIIFFLMLLLLIWRN